MNQIVNDYIGKTSTVIENYSGAELNLLILGSFGLLIGLILNHYSLK